MPARRLETGIPVLVRASCAPLRIPLDGREVTIYNLVGKLLVEGGTGDRIVVEVTRGDRDAGRLKLETGNVRGRMALRVQYPEIDPLLGHELERSLHVYHLRRRHLRRQRAWSRSAPHRGQQPRRLDAHADLHVIAPKGKTRYLRQGIGETTIDNVDGQLSVVVAAAHTRVSHVRGSLSLDNGSGGVEITDMSGDLTLDSDSGGATLDGIRGGRLTMDIGSGSRRGRTIEVSELVGDVAPAASDFPA